MSRFKSLANGRRYEPKLRGFLLRVGETRFYAALREPAWPLDLVHSPENWVRRPGTERTRTNYSGELMAAANLFREKVLGLARW